MKLFRTDNTEDYTQAELDALNTEWADIAANIEEYTDEYDTQSKRFSDEVARR